MEKDAKKDRAFFMFYIFYEFYLNKSMLFPNLVLIADF